MQGSASIHRDAARVGLTVLLSCVAVAGCGRSPDEVVRISVADPIPPSVQILQAQEGGGLSIQHWTHFRISPADLAALLATDSFERNPPFDQSFDFRSLQAPSWWTPQSLGAGVRRYQCQDREHHEEAVWEKILFVNTANDEVYFVLNYIY